MDPFEYCVGNLLALLLLVLDITTEGCETGFFGKGCKYQCHCTSDDKCTETGSCSDGKCKKGYFEHACQTYDSFARYQSNVEEALYDNDYNTCISDKTTYQAVYTRSIPFSWMRIVFNRNTDASEVGKGMTAEINGEACKKQTFRPAGNTLDLFCNQEAVIEMQMFKLTFPWAVGLCSIYTSYGSDLTLKADKIISLSSYPKNIRLTAPQGAFDGKEDSSLNRGEPCYHSGKENNPWLQVFFKSRARVFGFHIVNRVEQTVHADRRLMGFVFETLDENNQTVQKYTDRDDSPQRTYDISLLPEHGSYAGSTHAVIRIPRDDTYLTICEMRVFGEHFYGGTCINLGNCRPDMICKNNFCQCDEHWVYNTVTKMCIEVLFGTKCYLKKSDGCRETQVCLNGKCGCKNLYRYNKTTDLCDFPLPLGARCKKTGFYVCTLDGMFCDSESSTCVCNMTTHYPHNDIVCLPKKQRFSTCEGTEECGQNTSCINETCQCQPQNQYWDLNQSECKDKCAAGMFGPGCKEICPAKCKDKLCDQSNGACIQKAGCTNDAQCLRPKERCSKGKCICSTTFYYEPIKRSCEPRRPLKDPCKLREACALGSTCVHGKCECDPEERFYDKQTGQCFKKATEHVGCNSTETCAPDLECIDNVCKCPFTLVYNNETRKCHTRHVPVPLFGSFAEKISLVSIVTVFALYLILRLMCIYRSGRRRFLSYNRTLMLISRKSMLRTRNLRLSDEKIMMPGETAV